VLEREKPFDLGIFHPPCTFLSYVANRHNGIPGRLEKRKEAMKFFLKLYNLNIPRICVENPVGYPNTVFRKPDQIIHPYFFGEPIQKRTCLWLKNLPLLNYDKDNIIKPEPLYICKGKICNGKKINFVEGIKGSGIERQKNRSRTFVSIAAAMADQWGSL
jgi:hypothetical protein